MRRIGAAFSSPIQSIIDFIARYRVPLLVLSAIAVAWTIFGEFRGNDSELKTLRSLGEDGEDSDGTDAANDTDAESGEVDDTI